jgi:hypothetical protein
MFHSDSTDLTVHEWAAQVDEQSGLVDFFDYLTVMDFVLQYEPPDPALLCEH